MEMTIAAEMMIRTVHAVHINFALNYNKTATLMIKGWQFFLISSLLVALLQFPAFAGVLTF